MIFWILAGLLTFIVVLALLWPLFTERADIGDRPEFGLTVYRDQLQELERDRAAGQLDVADYAATRLEIERRMLALAPGKDGGVKVAAERRRLGTLRRNFALIAVLVAVPAASLATYLNAGNPGLPGQPLAGRALERSQVAEARQQQAGSVQNMVEGLQARLQKDPSDVEGWSLLGRSYMVLGQYGEAVGALRDARQLTPTDPLVLAALGEAVTLAADGQVTPEARRIFQATLASDPAEPRARFYFGLAERQAGQLQIALNWWLKLEADTPADAPWIGLLKRNIAETAAEAGVDLAARRAKLGTAPGTAKPERGPSAEDVRAAQGMSSGDRTAMINSMVERLADRLAEESDDLEGWRKLARSYGVLKRPQDALNAHAKAAALALDQVEVQLDYARALFPPGSDEQALPAEFKAVIRRIGTLDPGNAEGQFFLGVVAAADGDKVAARAAWSSLLQRMGAAAPARPMLEQRIKALGE